MKRTADTSHPQCRICLDGTFATKSMQTFLDSAEEQEPWGHYCDECAVAMASVIKDSQKRTPEIRLLPPPPNGKAPLAAPKAPKAVAKPVDPPPAPTPAPRDLQALLVPTAPARKPVLPPPPTPAPARNALREAMQGVQGSTVGYDLLTMLGMKKDPVNVPR